MKLIKGSKYKITFDNGISDIVTYDFECKGINYTCNKCKKQRWHTHHFLKGDVNNPDYSYQYGTECIKQIKIEPIED